MSTVVTPAPALPPKPVQNSIFSHAKYVIAENPVTGLAFALFAVIALLRIDRTLCRTARPAGE